ncbi:MAG: hypothetical protein UU76_C0002G0022 [Parcubacteria group bacterium GW2011_GWC1_41_7]|nr:MAG: hypothetical protein UU76_C0002G0022 [Parcubacteria group bacterium GW2011_GWC1_41_7]
MDMKKKRVVVIGGGTGTFTALTALRPHDFDLSAIVAMTDDGGSTGQLRDELGVLPPGDLRQALVALSDSPKVMRDLFTYRFSGKVSGGLSGHNFGNLFLSALEKVTGNFETALNQVHQVLHIQGRVIPVTLDHVQLIAKTKSGRRILGEHSIGDGWFTGKDPLKSIALRPKAHAYSGALSAIKNADYIVIGPGSIFGSLLPNFLVEGITQGLSKTKAKIIFVCNLVNKYGETDDFLVEDHVQLLQQYVGEVFDAVLFNTKIPDVKLLRKYRHEGELIPVPTQKIFSQQGVQFFGYPMIFGGKVQDKIKKEHFIRHNPVLLGKALIHTFALLK